MALTRRVWRARLRCVPPAGADGEGEAKALGGPYPAPELYGQGGEEDEQGWVSWAWSFVPAIVSADEEEGEEGYYQEGEEGGRPRSRQRHAPKDPVVSIGFYCTKASVTFKVRLGFSGKGHVSFCWPSGHCVE